MTRETVRKAAFLLERLDALRRFNSALVTHPGWFVRLYAGSDDGETATLMGDEARAALELVFKAINKELTDLGVEN